MSPYLTLPLRTRAEAAATIRARQPADELRKQQIRTLIDLENAESDAWDRGQDAAAVDYRRRAIALRNLLALTNHTVPESPDAEANRLEDAAKW